MPDQGHFATCFADSPVIMGNLAEIPIAVTGTWVKDGHRFSITKEDLDDIVSNFEARQNGTVVIDYEHASERPEVAKGGPIPAAAWIHSLSTKKDPETKKETLWASVEWTPNAEKFIKAGEYRYFSPAIDWGAADKKTGRSKGATLTSGALTNHPFLEELPAIQLSDTAAKPMGKTIVVPVVDNAKIKVKVDAKHDEEKATDNKTSLSDVSFDQTRSAVSDAINEKYRKNLAYPDMCCDYGFWIKELYDSYAIIDANGKMFKIPYTIDKDQNVTLAEPEEVVTQYVTASESGAVTKSEGDGDHPSSHYLVTEDPEKSTTWHLRIKDKEGKNDHGLMGAAWAALHDGYRGSKYEGPDKSKATTKLQSLYKSEGLKTPDQQKEESSEVKTVNMTDAQFSAAVLKAVTLTEGSPKGKKAKTLCSNIRKTATAASDGKVSKDLVSLSLKLLDDMDQFGVDGDVGEQEKLRKEAEKRAAAIDKPSDADETEVLSTTAGDNDPEDDDDDEEDGAGGVAKFSIRKIKAEDKVGKMKHHAIIGKDGKMAGYVTDGALKAHAKKMGMKGAEAGRDQGTLKASEIVEAEIKNVTGRPLKLSEVAQYVERGISATDIQARGKAHKLMLSTAIVDGVGISERAVRRLLAEGRVSQVDYADFADAYEDVENAVKDGRLLPKQRGAAIALCLSDRSSFESFVKDQPKSDRMTTVGIGGTGMESDDPGKELMSRISQYQKDNGGEEKMPYKEAYTRVLASDSNLATRYRASQTKLM
jgi:hypothetical protein